MTKIIKNGIQYNIDPSTVNAKELLVTTPQVEVIAGSRNAFNMGLFKNNLESFKEATRLEINVVDCDANIVKHLVINSNISKWLKLFQYKPFSTTFMEGFFYKNNKLIGNVASNIDIEIL